MCNISNCNACAVNNFCGNCSNNMTITEYGTCVTCNRSSPGCIGCTNESICVCQDGYMLSVDNITNNSFCIACNIPFCTSCSSDNVCTACAMNYTLQTNGTYCQINDTMTVVACPSECFTCNSMGNCTTYLPPRGLFSGLVNNIANCMAYATTDFLTCTTCY